jgi:Na+/H+ antiporter NhaD/arsenite permease-like protein
VVIAANAGGAWTPIGDVTTTMLWVRGLITTLPTMRDILLPAAVSLLVPLALLSAATDAEAAPDAPAEPPRPPQPPSAAQLLLSADSAWRADDGGLDAGEARGRLVFYAGVAALLFVPVFKTATGLPPYLGMLFGLGALWVLTDALHQGESEDRSRYKVPQALSRIDVQGVLFFFGILMSISSLDSAGVLKSLAVSLDSVAPNVESVAVVIGLVSAVIDNVPLVAATMGMYSVGDWPADSKLWQLIAFCAGTGGSILIIGSAAGVAFMGMERVDFAWYLRKVTPLALAGYVAGVGAYVAMNTLLPHHT